MLVAGLSVVLAVGPPSVGAQEDPTELPTPPAPAAFDPQAVLAEGAMWLPLRVDLDGQEITLGCTYRSTGSANGYECGGHHGRWALDFIATTGTPVFPALAGFATDVTGQRGGGGFGTVVQIDHGGGSSTLYAHLDRSLVPPEGRWVDEDDQIGTVGSTGSSSTPHLHFERFQQDPGAGGRTSVDPGPLLACRGDWLVSYPQAGGHDSWAALPWGSFTVGSDGPRCALPDPADVAPAAEIAEPRADWSDRVGSLIRVVGAAGWWLPATG